MADLIISIKLVCELYRCCIWFAVCCCKCNSSSILACINRIYLCSSFSFYNFYRLRIVSCNLYFLDKILSRVNKHCKGIACSTFNNKRLCITLRSFVYIFIKLCNLEKESRCTEILNTCINLLSDL